MKLIPFNAHKYRMKGNYVTRTGIPAVLVGKDPFDKERPWVIAREDGCLFQVDDNGIQGAELTDEYDVFQVVPEEEPIRWDVLPFWVAVKFQDNPILYIATERNSFAQTLCVQGRHMTLQELADLNAMWVNIASSNDPWHSFRKDDF